MIELIGDVNLEKYMGTWLEMARIRRLYPCCKYKKYLC